MLAGGGAKGAYQFGCMKALKEKGFEFSAVSGTSVGALNGVIWSTGDFADGQKIWDEISYSNVYPVKMINPSRHKPWIIKAAALIYVSLALIWSTWRGMPTPGRPLWIAFISLCSLILLPLFAVAGMATAWAWWTCILFPILFISLLLRRSVRHYFFFLVIVYSWTFGFWGLLSTFVKDDGSTRAVFVQLGCALCSVCMTMGTLALLGYVFSTMFSPEMGFLSQSGLSQDVRTILGHALKIPTFATLSWECDLFDPDDPRWFSDRQDLHLQVDGSSIYIPDSNSTLHPNSKMSWLPKYAALHSMSSESREKACLASAALPFGVVPSVSLSFRIGSRDVTTFCDGGVSDNVPIFPFMNQPQIDEIFVLLLEPIKSQASAKNKYGANPKAWRKRERDLRLTQFSVPKDILERNQRKRQYVRKNKPPTILPFHELSHIPDIIFIAPPTRLGKGVVPGFIREFVGGTLRFERDYASDLMLFGYLDTLNFLARRQQDVNGIAGAPEVPLKNVGG